MSNRKLIIGTLIIIGIAISWVASTQVSQRIQNSENFSCPFFIIWFSTGWIILCLIPPILKRNRLKEALNDNQLPMKKLFFCSIFFYSLWIIANYLYVWSLKFMNASDVTAIFSSANAFVFIFSIFLLKESVNYIKTASVLFSIAGIVLIALANTDFQGSAYGIIFTLISAISAAFYKVLLKKFLKDPHLIVTSLFLGFLALINIFFAWPIIVILTELNVEVIVYDAIPWSFLIGGSLASFLFNVLINFGIAYTYPLFISIGTIVGIPLNIAVDVGINGADVGVKQISGAILIIVGFCCLLINNYLMLKRGERAQIRESLLIKEKTSENLKEESKKSSMSLTVDGENLVARE